MYDVTTTNGLDAKIAQDIAEYLNGGKFHDSAFYTEERRNLWIKHSVKIHDIVYSNHERAMGVSRSQYTTIL